MRFRTLVAALAMMAGSTGVALAQAYPTKPVTLIVPFAAGGPTDIIARIAADQMSKALGQTIVVENVAGAGGTTGISRGASAAADGYTIMMGHMGTHGAAPALYPNLKYDPAKSFTPIGLVAGTPILVVAKKGIPAKTMAEFVGWLKANEAKVNQAHAGIGSVSHTSCTLFNSMVGIKPTQVAFRGTGPALNDLVGGQVDYMCDQIVNLVEQVKGGNIVAYGVATDIRSPALPDTQTSAEGGFGQFKVSAWNALFGPKDLPKDVAEKLVAALDKALDDDATRKRLLDLGSVLPDKAGRTPTALQALVESEVARWTPVLKAAGVTGQ
jgi:tripartite-type tricarboxylate transporter receptor subunit TctC